MTWKEHADQSLRLLLENMVAESQLSAAVGLVVSPSDVVRGSLAMIEDVIRTSFPLAQIMDTSDLVVHAEGPSVREDALKLSAVNWLTVTTEKALRQLSGSLFNLAGRDAKRLRNAVDLRLTGFARGSLYAGFLLGPPAADLLIAGDEHVFVTIREAIQQLPEVPPMIGDEAIDSQVRELIPDPAQRDSTYSALYQLAPTGKRGIHTLDISSPGHPSSELSQKERVVLKDAIEKPTLSNKKYGKFSGEIREIDIDARRFHLRNVESVGVLRCVTNSLDGGRAKALIGEFVQISGEFEADREGRPRLMIVNEIKVLPRASQPSLG